MSKSPNIAYISLSMVFLCLYVIGITYPDTWWGIHFFAFVPGVWKWLWMFLGMGVLLLGTINWKVPKSFRFPKFGFLPIVLFASIQAAVFVLLPIAKDIYGDAIIIGQSLETIYHEVPEQYYEGLFGLNFNPSSGRRTLVPLYIYFSTITGFSLKEVFVGMGVVFGTGFSLTWMLFLKRYLSSEIWKYSLAIIGLGSPFMLIYFGHMEFYTVAYFLELLWFVVLLNYLDKKRLWQLMVLVFLLLLCIKMHPTGFLLIPALILSIAHVYQDSLGFLKKLTTFKGILTYMFTPIITAGLILYFFVFASYNDPRNMENSSDLDHVFLPLVSPPAPYDRYNLFSFNHFLDMFNAMLLWSPALLFIGGILAWKHRALAKQQKMPLLIVGFTLVLYLLFLFAINPKVSLPMDWDLFCFPVIFLMLMLAILVKQLPADAPISKSSLFIALGFLVLNAPVFWVNSNMKTLSQRYESLGTRIFRTYYEWSETTLLTSVGMLYKDDIGESYIERKLAITEKLKPDAIMGNDTIYGMILLDNAFYYLDVENNLEAAQVQLNEAYRYSPTNPMIILKLMECNFRLGKYKAAYRLAQELAPLEYPDRKKALRIVIHCAIEAEERTEAIKHCENYLLEYSEDTFIYSIYQDLRSDKDGAAIKLRFKSGE